jgi:hypothetical protein
MPNTTTQPATALDIIKRSMRLLGVYSIGETPSSEECADSLRALNAMLDSWSTENLLIYAKTLDAIPLTANNGTYTIGPSGSTVSARPIEVSNASYIDFQGVSYPLRIDTLKDYNNIPVKALVAGIPTELCALPSVPNATLQLWPVPSASMTLNLWSGKVLQSFSSLTDVVNLPPGYERALGYCLAEEMGPEFDVQVSADILKKAAQARKNIKRINAEVPRLMMPYGVPSRGYVNYRNA